ncbi:MAG: FecR domain-containing protein [Spirochaetes bacterium]|nr:FecR domain-containing protein [Spirochaetota bacterium]
MKISKKSLRLALYKNLEIPFDKDAVNDDQANLIADKMKKESLKFFDKQIPFDENFSKFLEKVGKKKQGYSYYKSNKLTHSFKHQIKRKLISISSIAAAVLLFLFLPQINKKTKYIPFKIIAFKGRPSIRINGKQNKYTTKDTLSGNLLIKTKKHERILISSIGNKILVMGNSALNLVKAKKVNGLLNTRLELKKGMAIFSLNKNTHNIQVKISRGDVRLIGSSFSIHVKKNQTRVAVSKGKAVFMPNKQSQVVTVADGNALIIGKTKTRHIREYHKNNSFRDLWNPVEKIKTIEKSTNTKQKPKMKNKAKQLYTERIYMKDGSIITGRILYQDKNKIKVQTDLGIVTILYKEVQKVTFNR